MRPVDDGFSEEAEQHVRDLLAAQPQPPMPDHVRARIQSAIAAEPRPESDRAAGGGRGRWIGFAVAAAVVILAGFLVVPVLRKAEGPTLPLDGTTAQTACPVQPLTYDSKTRYQEAGLPTQARSLIPPGCGSGGAPAAPALAARPAAMAPRLAARVVACVVRVARSAHVMVVDRGYYDNRPAVVAVVEPPLRALAITCRKQSPRLLEDVALQ